MAIPTPPAAPNPLSTTFAADALAFTQWMHTAAPEFDTAVTDANAAVGDAEQAVGDAEQAVLDAAAQVGLATTQAGNASSSATTASGHAIAADNARAAAVIAKDAAEDARDMSQTYAALAGAAAGLPALAGQALKQLQVKADESGVQWGFPLLSSPIGTITSVATTPPMDGTWLACDGSVYLQASYAALYAELGLLANSPDSAGAWTQRTLPTSASWRSVTYGNGVFVAVAVSSTIAATSPDGITWTQRVLPTSTAWISVTYGNGVFVAVAVNSTIAATSPDGITWTQRTLPASKAWI